MNIVDKIKKARVAMLIRKEFAFFGNLAIRLEIVDGSGWCQTAATDGKYFYYNREFLDSLSQNEIIFVVAHETMHCVYQHFSRRGNRNPRLWNSAGDFLINYELKQCGLGYFPHCITVLYDEKFVGMSTEQIYDILFDENEKKKNQMKDLMDKLKDQKGQGQGQGSSQDSEDGDSDGENSSYDVTTIDSFDEHLDGNNTNNKNKTDPSGMNGPKPLTDEERAIISDDIVKSISDAAACTGNAGNLPGGVKRIIQDITKPKMDWREMLQMNIQSTIMNDYTFTRESKKTRQLSVYLPDMDRDVKVECAIAVDTSGSISKKMLQDFLGEIAGIMQQFTDFEIILWCFDTSVYNPVTITADNLLDLHTYELDGFGGTKFEANWDYMKDNHIDPKKFIMMTDGYPCYTWGDENYCDTIFLIHGRNCENIIAPFGTTLYYEPK